ncbi:type II toxin-antitoxin system VapC family toxin [Anatilimnocola sp. NA78]|uniref:type II toxin-antitoxin system VapC family toxin n=1 Tax=Anatilimnocola sp. NA78 TaxID=3415683 RepID=UPI003CE4ADEC
MSVLLDTSVLCRLANNVDVDHAITNAVLVKIHRQGERSCITAQNLIEFRNVATRPTSVNGLGMSAHHADLMSEDFERTFHFLSEIPTIFTAWKSLVTNAGVIGKQVHDARLVAVCHAHQIDQLLTFNVGHFTRLAAFGPPLKILDPRTYSPPA